MDTERTRCLNLDWLEVYVLEDMARFPCDAFYYMSQGYVVHERDYGTRTYAQMFTLDDEQGQPFLEIRRAPLSSKMRNGGLFPENACHIRLTNYACYQPDVVNRLRGFLLKHGYEFVKIYRIDLALDFERFDLGDDPAKFIERFMSGKYSKVNQTNISAHGGDNWSGRVWHSISWGKPSSMVSTKMYCKTIELQQVKDKPYIRWAWYLAGLITNPISMVRQCDDGTEYKPDIWRVEFSIKSSAKKCFIIERSDVRHGKIPMPYTLDVFDTNERRLLVFASLAAHYFRFKYYEPDQRKDRCKDKVLFRFNLGDKFVKLERYTKAAPTDNRLKRIENYLRTFSLFVSDAEVTKAIDTLLCYIDTLKLNAMVDATYDDAHIKALQALLRERMQGITSTSATKRLQQLVDIFADDTEIF